MALRPNEYRIGVTRRQEFVELKWTRNKPTNEGYYWLCIEVIVSIRELYLVHVQKDISDYLGISNGDYLESLDEYTNRHPSEWLGPLPVPELP